MITHPVFITITASSSGSPGAFSELLPWIIVLLAITVVGGIVLFVLRRAVHSHSTAYGSDFSLQDLRDLHSSGQLSEEEYERARRGLLGRITDAPTGDFPDNSRKS